MNALTQKIGLHAFNAEEFELYGDFVGGGVEAFGDNVVEGSAGTQAGNLISSYMGTATTVAGIAALFGLSCTKFGRRVATLCLLACRNKFEPGSAGWTVFDLTAQDSANSDIELAALSDSLESSYYDPSEL